MVKSEFNTGSKYARNSILARIIGLQNGTGNDINSERYQAYQTVYDIIVAIHGDMFEDFKDWVKLLFYGGNTMEKIEIGKVIETMEYLLITREDENFIYARRVFPYIALDEEFILFTKENVEKEIVAIGVKAIIDMNEVTRRYLDMA